MTTSNSIDVHHRCSISSQHNPEPSRYTERERNLESWSSCRYGQGSTRKDNFRIQQHGQLPYNSGEDCSNWAAVDALSLVLLRSPKREQALNSKPTTQADDSSGKTPVLRPSPSSPSSSSSSPLVTCPHSVGRSRLCTWYLEVGLLCQWDGGHF